MVLNLITSNETISSNIPQTSKQDTIHEMSELKRLKLRDPSPIQQASSQDSRHIITYIDVVIDQKIDTLQGLSLKYGCTVSEIKRLNNFVNDRDLYALSYCKIPIKEYSLNSEIYEKDIKRVHINDLYWLNNKTLNDWSNLNNKNDDDDAIKIDTNEVYAMSSDNENENYSSALNMNVYHNNYDDYGDGDSLSKKPLLEHDVLTATTSKTFKKAQTTTNTTTAAQKTQTQEALLLLKNIDKDLETIRESTEQQQLNFDKNKPTSSIFQSATRNQSSFQNEILKVDNSLCDLKEVVIIGFIILIVIPLVVYIYLRVLNTNNSANNDD